ncbi:Gfo/Idh/MocA family oxidoreductase [Xylanibacillus composti]|nr:Gfo/Idh/MocA family oxidoreductase [Xylanibacillus composti]
MSEGNGHPISFSAIINGFNEIELRKMGWNVIHDYMSERDPADVGLNGISVTHAWTQDEELTKQMSKACYIENIVKQPEDMIGHVDAVIIARDDYNTHVELSKPFLHAGLPVFIDKPLSLCPEEINFFKPYLASGQLMSCSAMRYARELDTVKRNISQYGDIKLIRGTVVNGWDKYGIHILDAIYPLLRSKCIAVTRIPANHTSIAIEMENGSAVQIDALGEIPKTFSIEIFGSKLRSSHEISDNFTMFRRMLWHFFNSIDKKRNAIPDVDTLTIMRILYAGHIAQQGSGRIVLDELGF